MTEETVPVLEPKPTEVVFILRDSLPPGNLEVSAVAWPPEFTPTSSAHVVAKFIQTNFPAILQAAQHAWIQAKNGTTAYELPVTADEKGDTIPGIALESGEFIPAEQLGGSDV
jgi:hypothetical protein